MAQKKRRNARITCPSAKPRVMTTDEVKARFLTHVRDMVAYWDARPEKTCREKMEGVVFSILATLDGASADMPGFVLAPHPHPDDAEYNRVSGENWYPPAPTVDGDIAGTLHEEVFR